MKIFSVFSIFIFSIFIVQCCLAARGIPSDNVRDVARQSAQGNLPQSGVLSTNSEKKKKVKKKEGEGTVETTPEETPAAAPSGSTHQSSKSAVSSSRRAKRADFNVFSLFSQQQMAELKEAFQFMDKDKDGIIEKGDLRATFDAVGELATDKEMEEMLGEASGPINFTQLLTLFASGGSAWTDLMTTLIEQP